MYIRPAMPCQSRGARVKRWLKKVGWKRKKIFSDFKHVEMLQHAMILWSFRILWLVWCHWCSFQDGGVKHRSCLVRGLPATRWHEFETCYDSGVFFEGNFHQKNVGFTWGWHGHEGSKLGLGEFFFVSKMMLRHQGQHATQVGGWLGDFPFWNLIGFFPLTFTERSLLQVCERWQQVQKWAPCAQNQRWSREGWVGQLHLLQHFCRKKLEDQSMLQICFFFKERLRHRSGAYFRYESGEPNGWRKDENKHWQWLHSISLIRVKHH